MEREKKDTLISEIKEYVSNNFTLAKLSDDELKDKIEELLQSKIQGEYLTISDRVDIVNQVYSSFRGFGLLDSIIDDDSIT